MNLIVNKMKVAKLVVDGEHAAHRAFHAFADLRTTQGMLSGSFYGFFQILLRKLEDFGPQTVAVCWGDERENLARKDIYKEYKGTREPSNPDLIQQIYDIQCSLHGMGIQQYWSPRQEADDCIATLAHTVEPLLGDAECIMILSGDKDMLQLITEKICVVAPASGFQKVDKNYDKMEVFAKYGVYPEQFADYLALVGDTSDNVPGVDGIGEVNAAKILNQLGPIKTWYSKIGSVIENLEINATSRKKLEAGKQDLLISKKLVSLAKSNVTMQLPPGLDDQNQELLSAEEMFDMYEMNKIRPEHIQQYLS